MSALPRINNVKVLANFRLAINWRLGGTDTIDLDGMIANFTPFHPLHDPTVFAEARIVAHGRGVAWPNGLDLSADTLWFAARQSRKAKSA